MKKMGVGSSTKIEPGLLPRLTIFSTTV